MSGNGIMGMGWSLNGGISAVSRISESIYNDKKVKGVSLTPEDRFSLDGQRLIITGGSSYGAANTIYRTEVESFKEVKAIGTLGSGPSSFEVTDLQSGTKFIYGTKALSRPTVQGKVEPYMWLLDKVTDLNGNYMEFTYQYSAGEEPRIANISYTANANTGVQARSLVSFYYDSRPDKNFYYIAGGKIYQSYRLGRVYVQQRNAANDLVTVHSYHLEYAADQYSHLVKVIEKGHELTGTPEQLPATEFTYKAPTQPITERYSPAIPFWKAGEHMVSGDFNGDGKSDIVALDKNNKNYSLYLSTCSPTSQQFAYTSTGPIPLSAPNGAFRKIPSSKNVPADYDGDGKDDMFFIQTYRSLNGSGVIDKQSYVISKFNSTTLEAILPIVSSNSNVTDFQSTQPFMGDFDGDGRVEILALNTSKQNGTSNAQPSYLIGYNYNTFSAPLNASVAKKFNPGELPFDAAYIAEGKSKIYTIDYNGDGKTDILSIWRDDAAGIDHAQVFELNVTFDANNKPVLGTPIFKLVNDAGYPTIFHEIYTGDFNGDAITDVLTWVDNGTSIGKWQIGYGNGNGTMNDNNHAVPITYKPKAYYGYGYNSPGYGYRPVILSDFNGDGKTDIYDYPIANYSSILSPRLIYSNGNDNFDVETINVDPNKEKFGFNAETYAIGDYNGDGVIDMLTAAVISDNTAYTPYLFSFYPYENRHKIGKITNGLGSSILVDYLPLTDTSIYNGDTPQQPGQGYPIVRRTIPIKIVSQVINDNGIDGSGNAIQYDYAGLKFHAHGKGLLGFDKVISKDIAKDITAVKTFDLNTTYALPYLQSTTLQQGQQLISSSSSNQEVYHYGMNRILPYTTQSTSTDYIKNTTATESHVYEWPASNVMYLSPNSAQTGKPKIIKTNKGNGLEETTQSFTFPNFMTGSFPSLTQTPSWVYMKPKSITTISTRQGQASYTRKQDFNYSSSNGLLLSTVTDPGTSYAQTTTNTYNQYGSQIQKAVSAAGLSPRTDIYQYDVTNRFLAKSYNADYPALQANTIYDIVTGTVSQITQADGLIKSFTYDGFNRVKTASNNNGVLTTTNNTWTSGNAYAPTNARYAVQTATNTSGNSYAFYDRLGRVVRTAAPSLNGQMVFEDQSYDNKGQLVTKSDPYFQGGSVQNSEFTYDNLGRATYQTTPSGNNTSFTYAISPTGALEIVTNAAGQSKKTYTDKAGTVIKTEDEGGILEYSYNSNGKINIATLNGVTVQQYVYDPYGRNTKRTDPNYGSYEYTYDNFDQLLSEKDPKGQMYNYTYNSLGKMTTKSGPEGTYAYIYNTTGGSNAGKLVQLTGPNGVTHSYNYGIGDKVNSEQRSIGNETFTTAFTYDAFGRAKTKKYPNGTTIEYSYNANTGGLQSIGKPGATYSVPTPFGGSWQQPAYLYSVLEENAFGQTTQAGYQSQFISGPVGTIPFTFRSNINYNAHGFLTGQLTYKQSINGAPAPTICNYSYNFQSSTGNLLQRKDQKYSLREDFTYDNVNRLIGIQGQYYGTNPMMFTPQSMSYAQNGNITQKADAGTFGYDQANRVSQINPYVNIPSTTQNVTYTPFDQVATIDEAPNKAQFAYWANQDRAKMELLENNALKKTKYYAGDYEKEIDAITGQVRELCYIYGPDNNLVSIIEKKKGIENTYYVQTDYLGSITQIFDGTGTIIKENSFDAWGRNRNPQTWAALSPVGTSDGWDRGYTGHEHLSQFGIINMNGRLYDPLLGRMMEPDPFIMGKNNSQGYNRYSYALNNPLKYTDPSGNVITLPVAMAIGAAASAAMYAGQVAFSDGGFKNWNWGNFGTSVFMGAVQGGSTFMVGEMFGATGSGLNELGRAAAHGAVGFITSGGDLRNAMVSAVGSFAGSIASNVPILKTPVGGFAFTVTAGGVSSSLTGGNFIEGAVSAALVHLLNQTVHNGGGNNDRKKGNAQHGHTPAPKDLPGFPDASGRKFNPESGRYRWKLPNGDILEWDKQHGEVERYDKSGKNHKGAFDPDTGEQIKPGDASRNTPKFSSPHPAYDGPRYTPAYQPLIGTPNPNVIRNTAIGIGVGVIILDVISTYWPVVLLL